MGSKYWCGNTECIWNSKRKCTMDYVTCKYCDKRKKNSIVVPISKNN